MNVALIILIHFVLTLALDALMGNAVQQHAALIAKRGRGVGGGDPAVLHLRAVSIEVGVLARTLEHHKLAAFLMYIKATFCVAIATD